MKLFEPIAEGIKESVGLAVALLMSIALAITGVAFQFINHLPLGKSSDKQHINANSH